jgi:hypothetical protein
MNVVEQLFYNDSWTLSWYVCSLNVIGDITIITKQGPDKYINEYSSRIVFPGREPQDIASEILDFFL